MATTIPASETMDARKTKVLVRYTVGANMSLEQYDETISRLEKSGD